MKKLLGVGLLTLCLSIPGFAGHTIPAGWCECGSFDACICDEGERPLGNASILAEPNPVDLGSGTLLVLAALLLALRYKA